MDAVVEDIKKIINKSELKKDTRLYTTKYIEELWNKKAGDEVDMKMFIIGTEEKTLIKQDIRFYSEKRSNKLKVFIIDMKKGTKSYNGERLPSNIPLEEKDYINKDKKIKYYEGDQQELTDSRIFLPQKMIVKKIEIVGNLKLIYVTNDKNMKTVKGEEELKKTYKMLTSKPEKESKKKYTGSFATFLEDTDDLLNVINKQDKPIKGLEYNKELIMVEEDELKDVFAPLLKYQYKYVKKTNKTEPMQYALVKINCKQVDYIRKKGLIYIQLKSKKIILNEKKREMIKYKMSNNKENKLQYNEFDV